MNDTLERQRHFKYGVEETFVIDPYTLRPEYVNPDAETYQDDAGRLWLLVD